MNHPKLLFNSIPPAETKVAMPRRRKTPRQGEDVPQPDAPPPPPAPVAALVAPQAIPQVAPAAAPLIVAPLQPRPLPPSQQPRPHGPGQQQPPARQGRYEGEGSSRERGTGPGRGRGRGRGQGPQYTGPSISPSSGAGPSSGSQADPYRGQPGPQYVEPASQGYPQSVYAPQSGLDQSAQYAQMMPMHKQQMSHPTQVASLSQAPPVHLAPQQYAAAPPAAVQGSGAVVGFVPGQVLFEQQFGSLQIQPLPPPPVRVSTVQDPEPPSPQAVAPPVSSKALRFPLRPGKGKLGQRCIVKANHFFAELPDKDLHQYDVSFLSYLFCRGYEGT